MPVHNVRQPKDVLIPLQTLPSYTGEQTTEYSPLPVSGQ